MRAQYFSGLYVLEELHTADSGVIGAFMGEEEPLAVATGMRVDSSDVFSLQSQEDTGSAVRGWSTPRALSRASEASSVACISRQQAVLSRSHSCVRTGTAAAVLQATKHAPSVAGAYAPTARIAASTSEAELRVTGFFNVSSLDEDSYILSYDQMRCSVKMQRFAAILYSWIERNDVEDYS